MSDKKLIVEREKFEFKGKEYMGYFVKGIVKGREVRATLKPQDINGYTVLDIIFEGANEVELVANPYSIKDETTDCPTIEANPLPGINPETNPDTPAIITLST